jgi:hypothetical protein
MGRADIVVTMVVSLLFKFPSLTVSLNSSVVAVATVGAVNVGFALVGVASVTGGPLSWVQANVRESSSGSEEPEPSRVTRLPALTV